LFNHLAYIGYRTVTVSALVLMKIV